MSHSNECVYSEIGDINTLHICDQQDLVYWHLISLLINKEHLWSPLMTVETETKVGEKRQRLA